VFVDCTGRVMRRYCSSSDEAISPSLLKTRFVNQDKNTKKQKKTGSEGQYDERMQKNFYHLFRHARNRRLNPKRPTWRIQRNKRIEEGAEGNEKKTT
jgi:hypothetical protein